MTLIEAIARQEGFNTPGTRAQRNHNPGNIRWGRFALAHGGLHGDDKQYAVFPDDATGFAALKALLSGAPYRGATLQKALDIYAPAADGNAPDVYVKNVCTWCGCTPATIIDSLI